MRSLAALLGVGAGRDEQAAGEPATLLAVNLEERRAAGPVNADDEQHQGTGRGAGDEDDAAEDGDQCCFGISHIGSAPFRDSREPFQHEDRNSGGGSQYQRENLTVRYPAARAVSLSCARRDFNLTVIYRGEIGVRYGSRYGPGGHVMYLHGS